MCNWSDVTNEVAAIITDCDGSEPPGRDAAKDHQSQGRPVGIGQAARQRKPNENNRVVPEIEKAIVEMAIRAVGIRPGAGHQRAQKAGADALAVWCAQRVCGTIWRPRAGAPPVIASLI
jgi:hypothetical protein